MNALLDRMDVVGSATALPAEGERAEIDLRRSGPPGRGDRVGMPAFTVDPRTGAELPAPLRKRVDRFTAVAHLAVRRLLDGLPSLPPRERVGVFLSNARAGWAYGEVELGLLVDHGAESMHAYQATAWFPAAAQGEVTIALDLRGCAKTTAGRTSGFAEALWLARDALERDAVDLAVVGATESLANGFVLGDWATSRPLPVTGHAEGAVVFALRRPGDDPVTRISGLRHESDTAEPATTPPDADTPDADWAPTLSAATRLHEALGAAEPTDVDLGGGFTITVNPLEGAPVHTVTSEIIQAGELAAIARHELLIPGAPDEVFEMTRDVTRWSEYMPAVTHAEFVEQEEHGDVVEISAEANAEKHVWRSRRAVDRERRTIEFSRVGASPPLVEMTGQWEFIGDGAATRAVLTHRFTTTTPEALEFFTNATRSNATRDLEGLAKHFTAEEATR